MLPQCDRMVSARAPSADTLFLPTLFERSPHWVHREQEGFPEEAVQDDFFFAHALAICAVEVVMLRARPGPLEPKDGIIVVGFRNSVLDAFETLPVSRSSSAHSDRIIDWEERIYIV